MASVLYTHRNENATLYMRLCPKGHANHSEPLKQNIMTQNNGIYLLLTFLSLKEKINNVQYQWKQSENNYRYPSEVNQISRCCRLNW